MSVALLLRNNWSKRGPTFWNQLHYLLLISPGFTWGSSIASLLFITPGPANENLTSSWESSSPPSSWSRLDSGFPSLFILFFDSLACLAYFREIYRLNSLFRSSSSFIFSSSLYFPYGRVPRTQNLRSPLSRTQRYQRFSHLRYDVPSVNFLDMTFTCVLGGSYLPECGICWACDVCLAANQFFLRRMVRTHDRYCLCV